eukprot:CAMPEP_0205900644 /NCGR_PEP_ID=MMETSP1083-20121108/27254_1 /ASSEMBLY_ACC=CAM_ASM_000430 /TAXON_ID=97485 /ORGANISM="Prymnesium parvum, Strain Texoma1" /LENGTH=170 /DNA_ID=CAMNT_0053266111 /DNA_START=991 /DNA_END=1504 /DNA_ORIENTATION=-
MDGGRSAHEEIGRVEGVLRDRRDRTHLAGLVDLWYGEVVAPDVRPACIDVLHLEQSVDSFENGRVVDVPGVRRMRTEPLVEIKITRPWATKCVNELEVPRVARLLVSNELSDRLEILERHQDEGEAQLLRRLHRGLQALAVAVPRARPLLQRIQVPLVPRVPTLREQHDE